MKIMKPILAAGVLLTLMASAPALLLAENTWPKEITTQKATIIIYQPQADSLVGDHLYTRAAISITTPGMKSPVFGAIWTDAKFSTDRDAGTGNISDVKVLNVRFPGIDTIDKAKVEKFKSILEEEATGWNLDFSIDEVKSSLALNDAAVKKSSDLNNAPPEIIYVKQKSQLVLIDGDPVLKEIGNAGLKRIINTPFLVLFDTKEKQYYLYGGQFWYKSAEPVKEAFTYVSKPSADVSKYFQAMQEEAKKKGQQPQAAAKPADGKKPVPPVIIVRTKPAELLQSEGEPAWAPIQGTGLLYMTNTEDNIFMTTDKNAYYVLLSGRWYRSAAMSGPWAFVESENLPADFAKIPEGSEKDIVLASVAGTNAAKEAVMDAQIPQTAAVDRSKAKCEVKYDGDPKFEVIKGTELSRAMNTGSTVLLYKGTYYVCDNAVWFTGKGPTGPWAVATSVPSEVQKIPPDDPAYNVKYVYIYDVQPEVVYVGYTPGYTGCYVYGPTVVYGTGFYYPPFYGPYYYPRPVTYGFSMHYNPYYGWSMGFSMSVGMVSFSMGGYPGGYWGPPMYRPPYHPPYNHYYGARPPAYRGGGNTINIDNSKNFYGSRGDGSARPSQQPRVSTRPATGDRTGAGGARPSTQPAGGDRAKPATRPATADRAGAGGAKPSTQPAGGNRQNNVYTDRSGDVYRNNNGNWERNNGRDWESAQNRQQGVQTRDQGQQTRQQPSSGNRGGFNSSEMDRQSQARQRSNQSMQNRSSMQRSSPAGGGARGGGGGGRRR